ncbi:ASCH domain-containing protein [uncultured Salegentibacter sp.]|uniref:ASCH domain-containing protein n=1 Tax=uncultured Salegentibacter sp. TaxID=259320 RepID=UPI0030D6FEFB
MNNGRENFKSVITLWEDFLTQNPQNKLGEVPVSFYFCDNEKDANECAELVVNGIKRATATSLWWFKKNNKPLPRAGDQQIVTDWNGNAKAIIETLKIEQVPFNKITEEFAATEGEGDKSLKYWKKVHKAYYEREMISYPEKFSEEMIIVCEYFKTIYPQ